MLPELLANARRLATPPSRRARTPASPNLFPEAFRPETPELFSVFEDIPPDFIPARSRLFLMRDTDSRASLELLTLPETTDEEAIGALDMTVVLAGAFDRPDPAGCIFWTLPLRAGVSLRRLVGAVFTRADLTLPSRSRWGLPVTPPPPLLSPSETPGPPKTRAPPLSALCHPRGGTARVLHGCRCC